MKRFLFVVLLGMTTGFAAENRTPQPLKIDAKASASLRKLTAIFETSRTAEADLTVTVREKAGDAALKYALTVEKPNRFAMLIKTNGEGASVVSDGTNVMAYAPGLKIYSEQPAPRDFLGLAGGASELEDGAGSMPFIAALFSSKPYEALLAGVLEGADGGMEKLEGQEFHRLNFKQQGLGWSLWLRDEAKPTLRRIEVDLSKLDANASALVMDFSAWKFDQPIERSRFQIAIPKDAKRIDRIVDAGKDVEGEDSDLIGDPAPAFKLKSIDGKEWDSSAWKGAPAIVIFWAGEQEHCIKALTTLSELGAADKGMKILAINADEKGDAAQIKELFTKHKISLPSALDAEGSVGEKFEVVGVPTTFLIDAGGMIRKAYLGYHSDFKTFLNAELAALRKIGPAK